MTKFYFQKLLVMVFLCNLMLVSWMADALANDVTVNISPAVECIYATTSDANEETNPWSGLVAMHVEVTVTEEDFGSDIFTGHQGALQGRSNANWWRTYIRWDDHGDWDAASLILGIDSGAVSYDWQDYMELDDTPTILVGVGDGNTRSSFPINWMVSGIDWGTPEGEYIATVIFTVENYT